MIKKILISGLAFFSLTFLNAQNTQVLNRTCGTEVPSQQWDEWFNKKVAEYKEHLVKNKLQMPNYTIPVVVHVIHAGGAVGVGDNISQAQVIDQINILNADIAGTGVNVGNCPSVFQSVIANCNLTFCLAVTNPTNGTKAIAQPGACTGNQGPHFRCTTKRGGTRMKSRESSPAHAKTWSQG
jgi:hypothetical protein